MLAYQTIAADQAAVAVVVLSLPEPSLSMDPLASVALTPHEAASVLSEQRHHV